MERSSTHRSNIRPSRLSVQRWRSPTGPAAGGVDAHDVGQHVLAGGLPVAHAAARSRTGRLYARGRATQPRPLVPSREPSLRGRASARAPVRLCCPAGSRRPASARTVTCVPVTARKVLSPPAAIDFDAIRGELGIPARYPAPALAEARAAARGAPARADEARSLDDATDIPFVTVDPPGSTDLDQAVYLERSRGGHVVHYAIADVVPFVAPDGPLAAETWRRGVTLYSPDRKTPLHPEELSEGAASLLPEVERPAVVWTIRLDEEGRPMDVDVRRARVVSRARLSYPEVQAAVESGDLHPSIAALPEVGLRRERLARERHAIELDLPDSEVVRGPDGHWTLELRAITAAERFNAQISLLTGICAARIMLDGGIGLLRTLPPPTPKQVQGLRHATAALGIEWPPGRPPGDVISALDGSAPREAAFLEDAVRLLRGAGYTPFDGEPPDLAFHGGVGAPYAHVTAPLRRLADRFATEICLALRSGTAVPAWVRSALPELPKAMSTAERTATALTKACSAAVSVFLLHGREGEEFTATVLQIETERARAIVVLHEPPVRAHCAPDGIVEGTVIRVRLLSADAAKNRFVVAPAD